MKKSEKLCSFRDLVDPLAVLVPAGFNLGNAEHAVAVPADLLGAVPLEQIARRAADASGRVKAAEAVLAALILIEEGPAQTEEREENEGEDLNDVGGEGRRGVEGTRDVGAEEAGEDAKE